MDRHPPASSGRSPAPAEPGLQPGRAPRARRAPLPAEPPAPAATRGPSLRRSRAPLRSRLRPGLSPAAAAARSALSRAALGPWPLAGGAAAARRLPQGLQRVQDVALHRGARRQLPHAGAAPRGARPKPALRNPRPPPRSAAAARQPRPGEARHCLRPSPGGRPRSEEPRSPSGVAPACVWGGACRSARLCLPGRAGERLGSLTLPRRGSSPGPAGLLRA